MACSLTRSTSRAAPGKQDGLYWATKAGEPPSPLGELVARASAEGYRASKGGRRRITATTTACSKGQAAEHDGAAFDYVVRGRAIGASRWSRIPRSTASSGIIAFIVNHDGKVYETDLGPQTTSNGAHDGTFDPAKRFTPVKQ